MQLSRRQYPVQSHRIAIVPVTTAHLARILAESLTPVICFTKPHDDFFRFGEDMLHDADLVRPLPEVVLIDAYLIDPYWNGRLAPAGPSKKGGGNLLRSVLVGLLKLR